jgi:hypothetical protein
MCTARNKLRKLHTVTNGRRLVARSPDDRGNHATAPPRKSGSHQTRSWREPDSNHRSRSCERLFWASPIGDGDTKGGATYRFRSETVVEGLFSPYFVEGGDLGDKGVLLD